MYFFKSVCSAKLYIYKYILLYLSLYFLVYLNTETEELKVEVF